MHACKSFDFILKVYQARQNCSFKLKLTGYNKNYRSRIIKETMNIIKLITNNYEILIKNLFAILLKEK